MPKWTKSSDWLPLDNAKAQVEFYKLDLIYAKNYLYLVQQQKSKMSPKFYQFNLKVAQKDVFDSITNLDKARKKLLESIKLE